MSEPKLVDMSYSKAEMAEEKKEMASCSGEPQPYPWGLCIRLEKEELAKLGITDLPDVGAEFHILAVAKVTSVNQSAREGDDEEKCVGLQICEMQVLLKESAAEEKAEGKDTPAKESRESASVLGKYKG